MNGCRYEDENRICQHPENQNEPGYIDYCAEGPGCDKRKPDYMTYEQLSDAIDNLRLLATMTGEIILLDKDCEVMFGMISDELEKSLQEVPAP